MLALLTTPLALVACTLALVLALLVTPLTLVLALLVAPLTLALPLFLAPLTLALLALALTGRSVLLSLALAFALTLTLPLSLTAALSGLGLILTLCRFLALHFALPGRSRTLAAFRARHALACRQHSSSQERGSRRCDEKFVFHDYDPPDFCPCRRVSALGKRWSASLVPSMR